MGIHRRFLIALDVVVITGAFKRVEGEPNQAFHRTETCVKNASRIYAYIEIRPKLIKISAVKSLELFVKLCSRVNLDGNLYKVSFI